MVKTGKWSNSHTGKTIRDQKYRTGDQSGNNMQNAETKKISKHHKECMYFKIKNIVSLYGKYQANVSNIQAG